MTYRVNIIFLGTHSSRDFQTGLPFKVSETRGRKPGPARRGTALGAFLAQFRQDRRWSQERLLEELAKANASFKKHAPKQYVSKIETGAIQFPARSDFWEAIATVTGKTVDDLQGLARRPDPSLSSRSTSESATQEVLILDAQSWVAEVGPENLDIWLLGPQSLPVVDDESIQGVWIENLSAGATYHVIWFLDQVKEWQFGEVSKVLKHIGANVSDSKRPTSATITHYATQLLADSQSVDFERIASPYNQMRNAGLEGNLFLQPLVGDAKLQSLKERLQLYWQKFSAIVVYCPKVPGFIPRANLRLMDVSVRLDGPRQSPFFWFSTEHAYELQAVLNDFNKEYRKHINSQPPIRTRKRQQRNASGLPQ
jgi:hypothetical protein